MTITTVTTVTFAYPEEREQEISFTHDNDMSEWTQCIYPEGVWYRKTEKIVIGEGEKDGKQNLE